MNWIKKFEETFNIQQLEESSPYLIIEGLRPYSQKIGEENLYIKVNKNTCDIYQKFDTIAFLVNKWIKIQDSFEMVMNLLTSSSILTLKILAYLKENSISPEDFACYLYDKRKVLLINRFNLNGQSQLNTIIKIVEDLINKKNKVYFLILGNRAYKSLENINGTILGRVIHPSGYNLNKRSSDYYQIWYKYNDEKVSNISGNDFSLSKYHRLASNKNLVR